MVKVADKDIERGINTLKDFIITKQAPKIMDIFCLANIALLSLGGKSEQDVNDKLEEIFSQDISGIIREYMRYYAELSVIGASLGENVLKSLITDADQKILDMNIYYRGDIINPACVNKLITELHHLKKTDVYTEYGAGIGSNVMMAAEKCDKAYGLDINQEYVVIANIKAYWSGKSPIFVMTDISRYDVSQYKANKTTVDMPFGIRNGYQYEEDKNSILEPYRSLIKRSGLAEWRYTLMAYLYNTKGRVISILNSGALFASPDSDLRKALVNQGIVEGVISLPEKLFKSSNIPINLVILSQGNKEVKFMDASDMFTKGRRINTISDEQIDEIIAMYDNCKDKCVAVSVNDIAMNDYILTPSRYVNAAGDNLPDFEGIALGEVCEMVERGSSIKASELEKISSQEPTNIRYLMLQNIQNGRMTGNLPYLKELDKKYDKFCITDGEIIISKMAPFKIGIASVKKGERILANGNLYRIKVKKDVIDPIYLMLFLRSDVGIQELSMAATGGTMSTISLKDIRKIKVPKVSLPEQKKITDKYISICKELDEIEEKRKALIKKVDALVSF